MKRELLVIAMLACGLFAACQRAETTASNANVNSPQKSASLGGNSNAVAASGQAKNNWGGDTTEQVKSPLPPPTGYVNDYAKVVDGRTKQRLEKMLDDLKRRAQIEFAVVTTQTTGAVDIYDYSLAVARGWNIGAKPRGDGLLLFVAVEDRKWHIQVSRSLEADLPDEKVAQLGQLMVEPFRAQRYGEGLTKCVEAIIAHLDARRKTEGGE
jgi:uncharacterized membrane protein YgcG